MNGFEIISKLGEGSYSVVYKVKRKMDSKIYALKKVRIKKLSDKEKENSINEIRLLASIKSPYVISYKEAFMDESGQYLCIVMEYGDRGDLYQKITRYKKKGLSFDEKDIWMIFIEMTKGLKALHDLKILHRDLKSANVFLFSDGTAKLGDLNVSKVAKKGVGYTQTGTPYYASPEVWNDEPYDSKSDIWSLACVTYEMLTLHPPFRAESMDGLYAKVIKGKYGKIDSKYSEDIAQLIDILLKTNPKERPSCSEILQNPIVVKRLEFFKNDEGSENKSTDENSSLLKTIRLPKNLYFLTNKLPKATYDKNDSSIFERDKDKEKENSAPKKIVTLPSIRNMVVRSDNNLRDKIINSEKKLLLINSNSKRSIRSPKGRYDNISSSDKKVNSGKRMLIRGREGGSNRSIINRGINELYRLYISQDAKKIKARYKPSIYGMYIPSGLRRDGSSGSLIGGRVIPNKRLSPIKS